MVKISPNSLLAEFQKRRRSIVKVWGPSLVAAAIVFLIAIQFIKPAPPDHFVIGTGNARGAYYNFAK